MKDRASQVNLRLAARVRELRAAQRLSLDSLAAKSGVSRSMLSLIERGECSPTAVLLEKLAAGLRVTLASLFEGASTAGQTPNSPVARRREQAEWQDPASGYIRRNVSPPGVRQPMHLVEICFPAGARITFDNSVRDTLVYQQIWLLEGTMEITLAGQCHRLCAGDCLAMQLDAPTTFHNPTRKPARYAVVIAAQPAPRRALHL